MRILRPTALAVLFLLPVVSAQALEVLEQGEPGAPGEDGGAAFAEGEETSDGPDPVSVSVRAIGGAGGVAPGPEEAAGNGGAAALGRVFGASSRGQDVSVSGIARGGAGGGSSFPGLAGDGASVALRNVVDGETEGALELVQRAQAGSGGGFGSGGRGGDASSHLVRHKNAGSLTLVSETLPSFGTGGGEGRADAVGMGSNAGGPATVYVTARGSNNPRGDEIVGTRAGDAEAWALGMTTGDERPVEVGRLQDFIDRVAATGARGGSVECSPDAGELKGNGGTARSSSVGIARGESPVVVIDNATGGISQCGGNAGFPFEYAPATSRASGVAAGGAPVDVASNATGGRARARAQAWGAGDAKAQANVTLVGQPGSEARGRAVAHGAQARALARVPSLSALGRPSFTFEVGAQRAGSATASAVGVHGALPRRSRRHRDAASLRIGADLPREALLAELARSPEVAGTIGEQEVPVLARIALRHSPWGASAGVLSGEFQLGPVSLASASLALFDVAAFGRGFGELRVRIERATLFGTPDVLFEGSYRNARSARAELEGLRVEAPALVGTLRLIVELEADGRFAALDFGVLLAVAPPPTP